MEHEEFIEKFDALTKVANANLRKWIVNIMTDLVKVDKESLLREIRSITLNSDLLREIFNYALEVEEYKICEVIKIVLEEKGEKVIK